VPIYRQMPKYRRLLRNGRAIRFEPEKNIWLLSLIHTIMEGGVAVKLIRWKVTSVPFRSRRVRLIISVLVGPNSVEIAFQNVYCSAA
jgi:hypothetical protein